MDRSFLSDASVVETSRDFVCVRMATYENEAEAAFLTSVFSGRSGNLENTVFTIMAPDGETKLTRAGRSPDMVFGPERGGGRGGPGGRRPPPPEDGADGESGADGMPSPAQAMVAKMQEIAERYPAKSGAGAAVGAMPYAENVRLGLNIAACDMLPVAIVVTKTDKEREALESTLRPLVWSDDVIGRVIYAATDDRADLAAVEGVGDDAALVIVQPDAYGLKGKVLAQARATDAASLANAFREALEKHAPGEKDAADHIRDGRREGVDWETAVPVSDPHASDRERPPR